jgi:hypothetical protein
VPLTSLPGSLPGLPMVAWHLTDCLHELCERKPTLLEVRGSLAPSPRVASCMLSDSPSSNAVEEAQ